MAMTVRHPFAQMTKVCNSLSRNFAYTLSDKKATSNLLKSAEREPIEVEEKQKCIIYHLSVGAYMEIIFPFLKQLSVGKVFDNGMSVDSVIPGKDEQGRHIDTVIHFTFNGLKSTVCFYNTTQRLKIEGKGYLTFSNHLHELLRKEVDKVAVNIDNYNKAVIAALSGKRKTVNRPVRSVRYKALTQLKCTKCNDVFHSKSLLNIHMNSTHTSGKSLSDESKIPIIDDLSLMDLSTQTDTGSAVELDEQCLTSKAVTLAPSNDTQTCTIQDEVLETSVHHLCSQCNSSFNSNDDLKNHQVIHENKEVKNTVDLSRPAPTNDIKPCQSSEESNVETFTCPFCKLYSKDLEMLKLHIEDIHMKNQSHNIAPENQIELISSESCYKCTMCSFSGTENELRIHLDNNHVECDTCTAVCADKNSLADHMKTHHELFTCEICNETFVHFPSLQEHFESMHSLHTCESCGLEFNTADGLKAHVIEEHEELVILHTMASQVNDLHNSSDPFQTEVLKLLQKVLDNQNVLRQEIFILRTSGTNVVNVKAPENIKTDQKNTKEKAPPNEVKSYASITSKRSPVKSKSGDEKTSYNTKDRKSADPNGYRRNRSRNRASSPLHRSDDHSRRNRSRNRVSSPIHRGNDHSRYRDQGNRPGFKPKYHNNRQRYEASDIRRSGRQHISPRFNHHQASYNRRLHFDQRIYHPQHYSQAQPPNHYVDYENSSYFYVPTPYFHANNQSMRDSRQGPFYESNFHRYNIPTTNRFNILGN